MANRNFIHDDFLLTNQTSRNLYHEYAAKMPIIDYHCHLPPEEIADDKTWSTITEVWLDGDHYKWRAMRSNGVDENYVTGDASHWDRFSNWAETMPKLIGNPLYHWNQLELARYFNVFDLLGPSSAEKIYSQCNELLGKEGLSSCKLIKQSNVKVICTTDDPCDTLEHHEKINTDSTIECKVIPAWRPDKAMMPEKGKDFISWVESLSEASGVKINGFDDFTDALQKRHQFFHEKGCRLSDHGIETFYAENYKEKEIHSIFQKAISGTDLDEKEILKFKSHMLYIFGVMDAEKNWVQQFHYGALRNNSKRLFEKLGPDIGCDSIGDWSVAEPMSKLFSRLDNEGKLAKTIIYPINPRDNELVGAMIGNFQDGTVAGKMQFGSGWWFNDQMDGMIRQIETLSQLGLLSRFVGMLTDSRSFLSFTRHEYFRRILCNKLGSEIESGTIPNDIELIGKMVEDICYNNAANYFDFGVDSI